MKQLMKQYDFNIPLKAVINVRAHEANANLAFSQAEGEVEYLFDVLDDLRRVGNPIYKIKKTKEELIEDLILTWEKMDLEFQSIEEVVND